MPTPRNDLHIRNVPPELRFKIKTQAAAMCMSYAEWLDFAADLVQMRVAVEAENRRFVNAPKGKE